MLRAAANTLVLGLLFFGFLHSLEVIVPARAIDGKQHWFASITLTNCLLRACPYWLFLNHFQKIPFESLRQK